MAEAAGEIHFHNILLRHSQGRGKGDPTHKYCGKNPNGQPQPYIVASAESSARRGNAITSYAHKKNQNTMQLTKSLKNQRFLQFCIKTNEKHMKMTICV